jgi:oligopeptidase B
VSPDGGLLAFSFDTSGAEVFTVRFRRLPSRVPSAEDDGAFTPAVPEKRVPPDFVRSLLEDVLRGTDGNLAWGADSREFYYITLDASQRSHKCWRHAVGQPQAADVCIYEEVDEAFNLGIERTPTGDFLLLTSASGETSEVRAVPLTARARAACGAAAAEGGPGGAGAEPLSSDLLLLAPRRTGVMYSVAHYRSGAPAPPAGVPADGKRSREPPSAFFILSNEGGARNFKLSVASPERPWAWVDVVPESEARYLTDVSVCARYLALAGREGGLSAAWVASQDAVEAALDARGGGGGGGGGALPPQLRLTALPPPPGSEAAYTLSLEDSEDGFFSSAVRFSYSSFKLPRTTCEWVVPPPSAGGGGGGAPPPSWGAARELPAPGAPPPHAGGPRVLYRDAVPNVDFSQYATARVFAAAADGARVPISLVYRPSAIGRGGGGSGGGGGGGGGGSGASEAPAPPSPLLLHGYGAYGEVEEPGFDDAALSLCDRGWVYAVAHVRGGGENGRAWYDAGKMGCKKTTFADFIACAEHLCAAGWTAPGLLVAEGGSAGGLCVGVAVNERPELWGGALLRVPFLDLSATMADPSLPLVKSEGEEWGDPASDAATFNYLRSYDPMQNVRSQAYPPLLLTAGLQDNRVGYWEAAKWAQRVRTACAGGGGDRVLLKVEMGEGHAGASDRYAAIRDVAFEWAWVLGTVKGGKR